MKTLRPELLEALKSVAGYVENGTVFAHAFLGDDCEIVLNNAPAIRDALAALPTIPEGNEVVEGEPKEGDAVLVNGKVWPVGKEIGRGDRSLSDGNFHTSADIILALGGILIRPIAKPDPYRPLEESELGKVCAGCRFSFLPFAGDQKAPRRVIDADDKFEYPLAMRNERTGDVCEWTRAEFLGAIPADSDTLRLLGRIEGDAQ